METIYRNGFKPQGVYNLSMARAILIEISNDGSCARYCESTYTFMKEKYINRYGRWQEIKYTKSGEPYIRWRTYGHNSRLYLKDFIRL